MLPFFLVRKKIESEKLVTVLNRYRLPKLSLYAVSPPNRFPARKVQAFVSFLAERFEAADLCDAVRGLSDTDHLLRVRFEHHQSVGLTAAQFFDDTDGRADQPRAAFFVIGAVGCKE